MQRQIQSETVLKVPHEKTLDGKTVPVRAMSETVQTQENLPKTHEFRQA